MSTVKADLQFQKNMGTSSSYLYSALLSAFKASMLCGASSHRGSVAESAAKWPGRLSRSLSAHRKVTSVVLSELLCALVMMLLKILMSTDLMV